jgi:hypothetical protein
LRTGAHAADAIARDPYATIGAGLAVLGREDERPDIIRLVKVPAFFGAALEAARPLVRLECGIFWRRSRFAL